MFLNLYCTIVLVLWGETFLNISVKHVTSTVSIFTTIAKIYTYCRSCSTPCCTQSTKKHIFVLEMCPKCFTANVFKVLHKKKKMKKYNQLTDINGLLKSTHSALSQVRKLFSLWSPSCHLSIPRSH